MHLLTELEKKHQWQQTSLTCSAVRTKPHRNDHIRQNIFCNISAQCFLKILLIWDTEKHTVLKEVRKLRFFFYFLTKKKNLHIKDKILDISQILKSIIKRTQKLLKGAMCLFLEELITCNEIYFSCVPNIIA